ncbi:hypothetical protein GUITHDRAFT_98974 [Guillardia theta CCMP2712]|uniref:EF-hand domain-containing protein n=2 Tax=Guillardia theta TaxID=55529 RepID=L1K3L5_GUITC|nr:hypothetical protein GUITHDRAFT_98974 [Guillardia theta CCMP2712]EKX55194.1 hypothetical protein GUITHDRAFT_98974 [Guillardia theta CCMP2712]|eukprot:XP_005842174.1 hypothetical protein GUITHDRAFT_98974 [Guillardia theta CCMP2712]
MAISVSYNLGELLDAETELDRDEEDRDGDGVTRLDTNDDEIRRIEQSSLAKHVASRDEMQDMRKTVDEDGRVHDDFIGFVLDRQEFKIHAQELARQAEQGTREEPVYDDWREREERMYLRRKNERRVQEEHHMQDLIHQQLNMEILARKTEEDVGNGIVEQVEAKFLQAALDARPKVFDLLSAKDSMDRTLEDFLLAVVNQCHVVAEQVRKSEWQVKSRDFAQSNRILNFGNEIRRGLKECVKLSLAALQCLLRWFQVFRCTLTSEHGQWHLVESSSRSSLVLQKLVNSEPDVSNSSDAEQHKRCHPMQGMSWLLFHEMDVSCRGFLLPSDVLEGLKRFGITSHHPQDQHGDEGRIDFDKFFQRILENADGSE